MDFRNVSCSTSDNILPKVILKVQPCKLYNDKYMIAPAQITKTQIFPFIAVPAFKSLNRNVLLIDRKENRNF